jgi:hypothetical protein
MASGSNGSLQGKAPATTAPAPTELTTEHMTTSNQEDADTKNWNTIEACIDRKPVYLEVIADICMDTAYLDKKLKEKKASESSHFEDRIYNMKGSGTIFQRDAAIGMAAGNRSHKDFKSLKPYVAENAFYWLSGTKPTTHIPFDCQIETFNLIKERRLSAGNPFQSNELPDKLDNDVWKKNGYACLANELMTPEMFENKGLGTQDECLHTVMSMKEPEMYVRLPIATDWEVKLGGCCTDMVAVSKKKGKLKLYQEFFDKFASVSRRSSVGAQ